MIPGQANRPDQIQLAVDDADRIQSSLHKVAFAPSSIDEAGSGMLKANKERLTEKQGNLKWITCGGFCGRSRLESSK